MDTTEVWSKQQEQDRYRERSNSALAYLRQHELAALSVPALFQKGCYEFAYAFWVMACAWADGQGDITEDAKTHAEREAFIREQYDKYFVQRARTAWDPEFEVEGITTDTAWVKRVDASLRHAAQAHSATPIYVICQISTKRGFPASNVYHCYLSLFRQVMVTRGLGLFGARWMVPEPKPATIQSMPFMGPVIDDILRTYEAASGVTSYPDINDLDQRLRHLLDIHQADTEVKSRDTEGKLGYIQARLEASGKLAPAPAAPNHTTPQQVPGIVVASFSDDSEYDGLTEGQSQIIFAMPLKARTTAKAIASAVRRTEDAVRTELGRIKENHPELLKLEQEKAPTPKNYWTRLK